MFTTQSLNHSPIFPNPMPQIPKPETEHEWPLLLRCGCVPLGSAKRATGLQPDFVIDYDYAWVQGLGRRIVQVYAPEAL